jgi:hypothetical protein
MGTTAVAPQAKLSTAGANALAIAAIRNNAVQKRIQLNPYTAATPASSPNINIQLQNVGLLRGVLIRFSATATNNDPSVAAAPSDFAAANMFSQIVYNDLANVTRIQTTGAHVFMLDSLRRQGIMGAAYVNDMPGQFGSVWSGLSTTPTIPPAGGTGTVSGFLFIPVAYSDTDLRGAVFSNITNANQSINLTINTTNVSAPTGSDNVNAIYQGPAAANVVLSNLTVTAYQDIYDQLPDYRYLPAGIAPGDWQAATGDRSGLMLPSWSMRWMYELKYSPFTGITAGVENVFPYTNQRQFLSTIAQYNNPARATGTDIAYWRLVAANSYEWFKMSPAAVAFETRRLIGDDFPAGFYVFDSRLKPINTIVSGNLQLVAFPTVATPSTAKMTMYYEDFALVATVTGATSLASGTN